jgi:hypothetical protein
MREFTDTELKEIEEFASLLFSPEVIAQVMGVELNDFVESIADISSPAAKAFSRGALMTEVELRRSILRLAKQGSSPAQTLSIKMRDELHLSLVNLKIK